MNNVHEQNRGLSEEKVYQAIERAVAELRQEEYDKHKKTTSGGNHGNSPQHKHALPPRNTSLLNAKHCQPQK